MPRLAFFLPTFYCSHCRDNQPQAGGNLMARCLSCTLLSFDFTWGFLEALAEDTCRNLSGPHPGAASAKGRSDPTRPPLTDGGRHHRKHSEVHSTWLLGSFGARPETALLTHSGNRFLFLFAYPPPSPLPLPWIASPNPPTACKPSSPPLLSENSG